MLRNIALTAIALAFCLIMFAYLQYAPERPPQTVDRIAVAPASTAIQVAHTPTAQPTATAEVVQVLTAAPTPTSTPTEAPETLETAVARVLEDNNRGIETPVSVSLILDTLTVRWALNDRADVVADADTQIEQALGVIGDEYRLINFEGTFGLIYPDGRRSEDVVLWVTYEGGREVSRKIAPVLGRE